jgi:hypothetical protein
MHFCVVLCIYGAQNSIAPQKFPYLNCDAPKYVVKQFFPFLFRTELTSSGTFGHAPRSNLRSSNRASGTYSRENDMADSRKTEAKREDDPVITETPVTDATTHMGAEVHRAAHEAGYMADTARDMGTTAVGAARDVVRGAIGVTEDLATGLIGGVTHVAAELVHGVRDVGYEVTDSAGGLIGAAGAVGETAVHTVTDLLVNVVGGVRQVIGAAMGRNGNGQGRPLARIERDVEPASMAPSRAGSGSSAPAVPAM